MEPTTIKEKKNKWHAIIQDLDIEVDPHTVRLMERMRMVAHAMYQLNESGLASTGLSYARFRLLMSLLAGEVADGRSELNPSEISTLQGISRNTVSTLIRDLEKEELIERHLDKTDRRRFNISLTENGRALVREHIGYHLKTTSDAYSALSVAEQIELIRLLDILGKSIQAERESRLDRQENI